MGFVPVPAEPSVVGAYLASLTDKAPKPRGMPMDGDARTAVATDETALSVDAALPATASVDAPAGAGSSKSSFPPPGETPTQHGPHGIRFDINHGARVVLPNRTEGSWRVRLRDLDTGNILFLSDNKGAFVGRAFSLGLAQDASSAS